MQLRKKKEQILRMISVASGVGCNISKTCTEVIIWVFTFITFFHYLPVRCLVPIVALVA